MNTNMISQTVLIILIVWDVITTYYGTISIFSGTNQNFIKKIGNIDLTTNFVAIIFSFGLITFILNHKLILRANYRVTKAVLFVAFIYDFGTSIYGTAALLGVHGNFGSAPAQWAVIILLSIMATSAPLVIHHVIDE